MSTLQVLVQAFDEHANGVQSCVVTLQLPPLHAPARLSIAVSLHVACEQVVPSGYFWQPPPPSHLPFVPHVEAPWSAQKPAGAAVPGATAVHVPLPARLQARPFFLSAQLMAPAVPWHVKGARQSPSPAQVILQAFVPQT